MVVNNNGNLLFHDASVLITTRRSGLFSKAIGTTHINFFKDAKARCLTQLERYEEAVHLFEQYEFKDIDNITMSYMDVALRGISKSYLARCYFHLGKQELAQQHAQSVVNKLSGFPHTAYYSFAREVLREVSI